MSIHLDESLQAAIEDSAAKWLNSQKLAELIDTQMEKTVTEAVTQALRSHSPLGKQISQAVASAMCINDRLQLPELGTLIGGIVQGRLQHIVNTAGRVQLEKEINAIFATAPSEIKLSDLVEEFKKDCGQFNDNIEVTAFVESSTVEGHSHIYMHQEKIEARSKYQCDIQIAVRSEKGVEDRGTVYMVRIGGREHKKGGGDIFAGPLYGFEKLLFNLYACGSTLILDEDDINHGGFN